MFFKKAPLENFVIFARKHLKRGSDTCFPVNNTKYVKAPIFGNIYELLPENIHRGVLH